MSHRILVTGAQGLVGRYLTKALMREFTDIEVVGIGRSAELSNHFTHDIEIKANEKIKAPLPNDLIIKDSNYRYVQLDTSNQLKLNDLIKSFSPTAIIHLASGLKGDTCSKLYNANVTGTINVLIACKAHLKDVPFIGVSSGSVYGFHSRAEHIPFKETLSLNPEDPYQFAKTAEETIIKEFCTQFYIPWLVLRVFNIVGPGQDERHVCGRFISQLVSIKNGFKPAVLNVSSLTSERDFVDVRDVSSNIIQLIKNRLYGEIYNICSGKPIPIEYILNSCLNEVFADRSSEVIINGLDESATPTDKNIGDNQKLLNAGGRIYYDINTSIRDIVSYYFALYQTKDPILESSK